VDVITGEGVAREAEASATVTKLALKQSAERSGEDVGCSVRVAKLDDADDLTLGLELELMELVEEGTKGAGIFYADLGAGERVHDAVGDDSAARNGDWCWRPESDRCCAG
jgi:hypothetical protein